jgi:hypothetical protein
MHDHLADGAVYRQVQQHVFVDRVVVRNVVRIELVEPARLASVDVAREYARGPLVVPGSLLSIPGAGIGRAVEDQIALRIERDPSPYRATARLPGFRRPAADAQVLALVAGVERLERRADQHILVRSRAVRLPHDPAGGGIQRGQPATHAELAAGDADQYLVFHHQRRHRHRFAAIDVAQLGAPELLAGGGIERDGLAVQRVEEQLAIGEHGAAIDHVAASYAL